MRLFLLPALAGISSLVLAMPGAGPANANGTGGAPPGAAQFARHCAACHSLTPGKATAAGPSLAGVFGQAAASGEFRYSPALKASGITWSRDTLDAYLAAPMTAVPGTRMATGVRDAEARAAIIAYLAKAAK